MVFIDQPKRPLRTPQQIISDQENLENCRLILRNHEHDITDARSRGASNGVISWMCSSRDLLKDLIDRQHNRLENDIRLFRNAIAA